MSDKACHECRHYARERTGPHEWVAHCRLHQADFMNADHCNLYLPGPCILEDEDDRWPYGGLGDK